MKNDRKSRKEHDFWNGTPAHRGIGSPQRQRDTSEVDTSSERTYRLGIGNIEFTLFCSNRVHTSIRFDSFQNSRKPIVGEHVKCVPRAACCRQRYYGKATTAISQRYVMITISTFLSGVRCADRCVWRRRRGRDACALVEYRDRPETRAFSVCV